MAAGLLSACGGSSDDAISGETFLVQQINVPNDAEWQINRPIQVRFNRAIDFSSVNLNSVNIRAPGGAPAIGVFTLVDERTITFQPRCPRADDLSDAGLVPGGIAYELRIVGNEGEQGVGVRASDGTSLSQSENRRFTTPRGVDSADIFFDTRVGPPSPVVRDEGSADLDTCYVEIGNDPNRRRYFERDETGVVRLAGSKLPLNLLSNVDEAVALMLVFDEPVAPSALNISSTRLPWQYLDQTGEWRDLETRVSLEQNCTEIGAVVRIEPLGTLPPGAELRAVMTTEFTDLVGDSNSLVRNAFAPTSVRRPGGLLADGLEETFLFFSGDAESRQDLENPSGDPIAEWGDGELRAGFAFNGTGGPGGTFDWEIPADTFFVLNTTVALIVGGPDFLPTDQQVVVDGVVDIRNLRIAEGGVLKIEGPNPCTILASGQIEILGTIDVSGTSNTGVVTLNTTNIPEPGAAGQAGGGRGGSGSPLTSASSPRGGNGFGAFNIEDGGGQGGEAGWNDEVNDEDVRRGGGGGGGKLGPNIYEDEALGLFDQSYVGLDAEQGMDNLSENASPGQPPAKGGVTGVVPPLGGLPAPSPFFDATTENDFLGAAFVETNPGESRVIIGELDALHAGSGGGGGGDASFTNGLPYPPPWDPTGDEKASGAGGGAGGLRVLTFGDIVFGEEGRIVCRGGSGGQGENTIGNPGVGAGGGGGSGGHVILETSARIDMSAVEGGQFGLAVHATGGQGGAGRGGAAGARFGMETIASADACPPTDPPQNICRGHHDSCGGDGGPGIIQLHTPEGLAGGDILLPPGLELGDVCQPPPIYTSANERMIPSFGRVSSARSVWIPLGLGGFDPDASAEPFFKNALYAFDNVDPTTGLVRTTGETIDRSAQVLLGPEELQPHPVLPSIGPDGRTLRIDATSLTSGPDRKYFDNPGLLDHAVLEISQISNPANLARFDVVDVDYSSDGATTVLMLTSPSDGPLLTSFTAPGGVEVSIVPSFFRVSTDGRVDHLPDAATIELLFQATRANAAGLPDEAAATALTADPDVLNSSPDNADFRFMRFQVRFDIDAQNDGLSPLSPIPSLTFLRIPFEFP